MFVWFLIGLYLVLNFILNFGNKYVLGNFHYPIFIIFAGTCMYGPLTAIMIGLGVSKFPTWNQSISSMPMLIGIGVIHAIGTAANNISVDNTSVGINQIIKACSPIATIFFSRVLEKKVFHWSVVLSTLAIVIGSVMATFTNAEGYMDLGIFFAAVSTILGGLECVLIGIAMKKYEMSAAQVTLLISGPSALTLLPLVLIFEMSFVFLSKLLNDGAFVGTLVFYLSIAASIFSYVHYLLISMTSAHYAQLVGSVKVALIVGASFFFIERHHLTHINIFGIGLTIAAFFAYSFLKSHFAVETVLVETKVKVEEMDLEELEKLNIDEEKK